MSAPAYSKGPWTFSVNNDCSEATISETAQHAWYQVKESLASFSAWSVVASSDSVSVKNIGDASPDLWTDWTTDVVGGTTPHSWILLENSVTGGQLCIDMTSTNEYLGTLLYSATGAFNADGTINARPTDTESLVLQSAQQWLSSAADGAIVNAQICDDDSITRFWIHQRDGALHGAFFVGLESLGGTIPSEWTGTYKQAVLRPNYNTNMSTNPVLQSPAYGAYDTTSARLYLYLVDATPYEGWNTAFATGEAYHQMSTGQGDVLTRINVDGEWGGGYPVCAIGTYRNVTTRGGSLGAFQDIYWSHQVHDMLDTYPASGARTWIKCGCFMLPWNGSTPLDVP